MKMSLAILWLVVGLAFSSPTWTAGAEGAPSGAPAATAAAGSAAAPAAGVGVPADYVIGPGDGIQVFVWLNPELSASVPVRPDGKISTPLVEDMVAAGKTPSQLARDIEVKLAEFIRQPTVNVIVTQAVSTFRQVNVVGQVRTPQSIPYRDGLKVLDAILAVGGTTDFASPNRAKIMRTEKDGRQTEIRVRLGDLLTRGDLRQNVELRPGDVLVVPQSIF
ncbi:MAG: polysaccharide export protein [Steroidobacteraceae bacterium]|nr:polysaccharide export protein [Steroidobacteraceae bacterium]